MTAPAVPLPTRTPDSTVPAERARKADPTLLSVLLIKLREFDGDATLALRGDVARLAQTVCDWNLADAEHAPKPRVVVSAHEVLHEQVTYLTHHVAEVMAAAKECPDDVFSAANATLGETFRRLGVLADKQTAVATQKLARLVPALYAARDRVTGEDR